MISESTHDTHLAQTPKTRGSAVPLSPQRLVVAANQGTCGYYETMPCITLCFLIPLFFTFIVHSSLPTSKLSLYSRHRPFLVTVISNGNQHLLHYCFPPNLPTDSHTQSPPP